MYHSLSKAGEYRVYSNLELFDESITSYLKKEYNIQYETASGLIGVVATKD